jgi:hypothetical protein
MHSVLKLRVNEFAPVSETLNLSARGTNEAEKIAGIYAERKGYKYWELQFQAYANNAPRLVRNSAEIYVDRDPLNEEKRGFLA